MPAVSGIASVRNLGLAEARGEWIAFHDADDVALPDRLACQRRFLAAERRWDAVFCNGERLGEPGTRIVPAKTVRRVSGRGLTPCDVFRGHPVYLQGALVHRRAFAAAGPFDATFRVQPDAEYGYRLFGRARAVFVDRVVFRYRWHTTNNSGDFLGGREDIARILERLRAEDPETVRAIGDRRLRARLARLYYKIGRQRLRRGEREPGRAALGRALTLRPLYLRFLALRLRAGL